jgi:formylglycine-generating enzyme required for sulfatase activity
MRLALLAILLVIALLASCTPVNLDTPMPAYDPGVDSAAWATIPAGAFLSGQEDHPATIGYDYQMMVTDVTVAAYVDFLNRALADGTVQVDGDSLVGAYPGDTFRGVKHEMRIDPGNYLLVPLNDPASPFSFAGNTFSAKTALENHPMANVSWFGAWKYCGYYT